jgi:hypothetical protein
LRLRSLPLARPHPWLLCPLRLLLLRLLQQRLLQQRLLQQRLPGPLRPPRPRRQ